MGEQAHILVSLVSPCLNEADVLAVFHERVCAVMDTIPNSTFELLFVDDGSTDTSLEVLYRLADADSRIKVIALSRNFGHQRAISAGCDFVSGDYVIVLDADLQDPPELIPDMVAQLRAGYDVVHMVRRVRPADSMLKRTTAWLFYAFAQRLILPELPRNAGDFKGFNRTVLHAYRAYNERVRFLRGVFAAIGFRQTSIQYARDARHAGKSRYSWKQSFRLAMDAVVSFSILPLRVSAAFAGLLWAGGIGYAIVQCVRALLGARITWWVTGVVVLAALLIGGLYFALWMIGEYVGRLYCEVQHRPLYHVRSTRNLKPSVAEVGGQAVD